MHSGRTTLPTLPLMSSRHRKPGALREVARDNIKTYTVIADILSFTKVVFLIKHQTIIKEIVGSNLDLFKYGVWLLRGVPLIGILP